MATIEELQAAAAVNQWKRNKLTIALKSSDIRKLRKYRVRWGWFEFYTILKACCVGGVDAIQLMDCVASLAQGYAYQFKRVKELENQIKATEPQNGVESHTADDIPF